MDYANPDALVSTEWLADHLNDAGMVIVDATSFPKKAGRNARDEFKGGHIPGARFFDINDIADQDSHLPHMLPDAKTFATKVGALGIGNSDRVIAYDSNAGAAAAARVWWMFRVFGHTNVAMLSGGFGKWKAEGRLVESREPTPTPKSFTVRTPDGGPDAALVRSAEDLLASLDGIADEQIVDARSAKRFAGIGSEPWPVNKVGHIPGSVNLPFYVLMDRERQGAIRTADEIAAVAQAAGVDLDRPIVTTCGSGVTAGILVLGLYLIGRDKVAMYDGSWADWGLRDDTPVELG